MLSIYCRQQAREVERGETDSGVVCDVDVRSQEVVNGDGDVVDMLSATSARGGAHIKRVGLRLEFV